MTLSLSLNIIGALYIAFIWLYYLRRLDIFQPESWQNILYLFIAGMITPLFVLKTAPLIHQLGWDLNGNLLNDFLYSIFGIGFLEEFAKIVPILLFLMVGDFADEPIDYIIFACASAVGFSTTENILYFESSGSEIMTLRALLSSLGHMLDTSIVAYGFVVFKYRKNINPIIHFLYFLLLAALTHGLYDFFLINRTFAGYGILLTLLCYFVFIEIWATINNNCLNNSPHFNKKIAIDSEGLQKTLMYLFGGLLFYQFFAVAVQSSLGYGFISLLSGLFLLINIMLVVTLRISRFKLVPGRWNPIRIRLPFRFQGIPYLGGTIEVRGETFNEIHINKHLGEEVMLVPFFLKKSQLKKNIKVKIIDKLYLQKDEIYFLIELDEELHVANYESKRALLKARSKGITLRHNRFPIAGLHLIPKNHVISSQDPIKTFGFVELVYIKEMQ